MSNQPAIGYELSFQQRHVWRLQQGAHGYQSRCVMLIDGAIDGDDLKGKLAAIIGRHEILRTTFRQLPGMLFPLQVVNEEAELTWRVVDRRRGGPPWPPLFGELRGVDAFCDLYGDAEECDTDFANGPLVHVTLFKLAPERHGLMISLPALCADVQTLNNIFQEVVQSYAGEEHDQEPMQYVDFCEWQDEVSKGENQEGVAFWLEKTPSLFEDLKLPFENPAADSSGAHSSTFVIDLARSDQLEELAHKCGTTVPTVAQACWHVLLARLTGNAEITVGTLCDGRKYDEVKLSCGLFAKRLPVQSRVESNITFVEAVERVQESISDALRWQDYFSLDDALASQNPVYSIGFDYEEQAASRTAAGHSFSIWKQEAFIDRCKIKLRIVSTEDKLQLELRYAPELFETEYVEQMGRCYAALLQSVTQDPLRAIDTLSLLDERDRRKIVLGFNETRSSYPGDQSFIQLFEAQVEKTPHHIAAVFEGQRLSYRELNARANQLASYLRRRGVVANSLIGLGAGRSLETLVGLLGILKAGAGYVPLDPELPTPRLAQLLADIQAPVVLAEKKYRDHFPRGPGEIVLLDADQALFASEPAANPPKHSSPEDIVYVIYTSGSTGVPKGVVVTNQNLVNYTSFICAQLSLIAPPAGLNFATVSTLAADLGNTAIFPSLASGGCLHIISYEVSTDANLFAQYNSEYAIDVLKIVPSHLRGLLVASSIGSGVLPRTCLILGGETFSLDLLKQLDELKPECAIINHYGPTEATVGAALAHVKVSDHNALSASVPIGRPLANTRIYILDEHGEPLPAGIAGELHIAGDGLARGYLHQPKQTAERFIPNPFGPSGERMYRTGDLARYLSDGNLEYLGRIDQQVKIRGFRIELGEIEAMLGQHPEVRDSIVVAREDTPGDKNLTAYIVLKQAREQAGEQAGEQAVGNGNDSLYQLPNGLQVAQQNKHETDFFYRQIFVDQANLKHGMTLPDNACVFDVGANIGLFTLYVHQQCRNPTIYAFEPSPPICKLLRQNTTRYSVNAHVFECGLSSENKVVPFTFYPEESCMSGFYADDGYERATLKSVMLGQFQTAAGAAPARELEELINERTRSEHFLCQLRTLSEIVAEQKIERIDLLKIDVEKSESDVLAGISDEDWKKIRQIVIEAHDLDGRVAELSILLNARGFDVHVEQDALLEGTDLFNIYAVRLQAEKPIAAAPVAINTKDSVSSEELKRFLETRLPHYMVPSQFIFMDSLPLTRNGKIDRRALPVPDNQRKENKYVAPGTHVEETLAQIWSEVLRLERVGIDDNFFALGGDSIRTIQIRYRAQERGLELLARDFFALPTIRQLAAVTRVNAVPSGTASKVERFSLISAEDRDRLPNDVEDAYPLAMLQAGMIFHSEYSAGSTTYLDIIGYHVRCRYDLDALQTAVAQLVKRHDVLRTSFDQQNYSEPLQLVHREVTAPIEVEDVSRLSGPEQERELAGWLERAKSRKFDLSRPPLLRVAVHLRSADTFQLTLCHHHAIIDGWSNSSLTTELLQRYLCLLDQRVYIEQPVESAYRDFVALERALIQSEDQARFWEERLKDSTVTTLPRWSTQSVEVGRELRRLHVPISLELSEKLKDVSSRAAVPVKSMLLAAHFKVMGLLAGQDDVMTGVVTHGRSTLPDGDLVVGLFLNSMPFRKKLGSGNWLELARELFADEQELEPFQTYPLAEIQRRTGGQPLFETLFNFSHFHVFNKLIGKSSQAGVATEGHPYNDPGWTQEGIEFLGVDSFEETNFTLLANFTTDLLPVKIRLDLSYDANILSDEQLELIGGYYARTLEAIVTDPTAAYAAFSPLATAEREQLLRVWNETGSGPDSDNCLHQIFETQVKQSPNELALVFEDEQLTYSELNSRANQLARYLQTFGIETESRVGICLERSIDMAVAVLAILKAGAVYVPVDTEYPSERISHVLSDAQLDALLTHKSVLPKLPELAAHVICVDQEKEQIAREGGEDLNSAVFLDNLAYITYTSGSTGRPKGVAVPERMLTNLIEWHLTDLKGGLRTLQFASIGFDLSFYEMFVCWLSGGTLYLLREELRRDVPALARFLLNHKIQKIVFPVVLLQQLAEECEAQGMVLSDLVEVISSGEQLQISNAIVEFFEKLPACKLHNHYGPSETHAATAYELPSDPRTWAPHPSIGRPIRGIHIYLLDHHLNPVPVGVAGELYISTSLARGYFNRPDLTAEKFIPHPFAENAGERLYRTGDLVRYATDGNLEFLGRVDHQIKIRGYRIELGEIEAVLAGHSDIREVVVRPETSQSGSAKSLIAFIVPEQNKTCAPSLSAPELRSFLGNKLPDYMVPSTFVILDSLPLTPNNKIDYRALAAIEYSPSEPTTIFTPARTPTEEIVGGIWSEVLGLERVGVHDNFFELGGHSLKATQIASRVRSAFQLELPVHSVIECPTVAELSATLDAAGTTEAPVLINSPRRIEEKGAMFPLSFAQQRLWFLSQLKSESAFYNVAGAIRLRGPLDVAALERSLNEVGRRHAVLRTTFRLIEGTPMQVISRESNLELRVTDLSDLPPTELEAEIQRLAVNEARKLFDLANGPLLRVSLLRCSSEDHVLLMTFHHIVSDGWSRGVLIRELTELYQAFSRGEDSNLPDLPLQYVDFAVWQREWLQGEVLQRQLDYWKEVLEGAPSVTRLPADRPRPPVQTFRSAKLSIKLPENLATALRQLSRREGVTIFMTLLAAFETLLYRYSGETDLVIGTTIANRRWAEIEGLIGFFTNSLVLRTDLSGNPSFRELLKRVRKVSLDAYAHQDLPFEKLVEELKIERTLSHTPLFQVVFSFQNSPAPEVKLPELVVSPMEIDSGAAMFDLILGMVDDGVGLTGVLLYSTDLFETSTAAKLLDDFTLLLEGVAAHPDKSLLDLEINPTEVNAPVATLLTSSYEVEQFEF